MRGHMKITHRKLIKSAAIHMEFDQQNYDANLHNFGVIFFTHVSINMCPHFGSTALETLAYQDLVYKLQFCGGRCGFSEKITATSSHQ